MEMPVALALHAVPAEVGQYPETIGRKGYAQFNCDISHPRHQRVLPVRSVGNEAVAPKVILAQMQFGHHQQHDGHPSQPVPNHHDVIVHVPNLGVPVPVRRDVTKNAVG